MKNIFLSLFFLLGTISLDAQNIKPVESKKVIHKDNKDHSGHKHSASDDKVIVDATIDFESKVVDYGVIEHNSDGQREFKFKSTGTDPLIIKSAKGSCGCTVPTWRKADGSATWQPGEDGSIGVKYATNRIGKFTKTITLSTNADKRPVILTIKGEVKSPPKDEGAMPVKKNDGSPLERK